MSRTWPLQLEVVAMAAMDWARMAEQREKALEDQSQERLTVLTTPGICNSDNVWFLS